MVVGVEASALGLSTFWGSALWCSLTVSFGARAWAWAVSSRSASSQVCVSMPWMPPRASQIWWARRAISSWVGWFIKREILYELTIPGRDRFLFVLGGFEPKAFLAQRCRGAERAP